MKIKVIFCTRLREPISRGCKCEPLVIYIQFNCNNTLVTVTNGENYFKGEIIRWRSRGECGFRGSRKR